MKTVLMLTTAAALCFSAAAMANENKSAKAHMGDNFKMMDSNKDGVVTKAEYDAYNPLRWKDMDTNNDGKVSNEEYNSYSMNDTGTDIKTEGAKTGNPADQRPQ